MAKKKQIKNIVFFSFVLLIVFINNANFNGFSSEISTRIIPTEVIKPFIIMLIWFYIYLNKIKFNFPLKVKRYIIIFLIVLLFVAFTRSNLQSSARNFLAIFTTYLSSTGLALISHKIPITKLYYAYIYLILLVILPLNIAVQVFFQGGFELFPDRFVNDSLRFGGALYHAHNGITIGIAALLLIHLIFQLGKKSKTNYFLLFISIISILFTDCRSVYAGLLISGYFLVIKTTKKKTTKFWFRLFTLIFVILSINSYKNIDRDLDSTESTLGRTTRWLIGLDGIRKSPFVGYGDENYFELSRNTLGRDFKQITDPHNAVLHLALQSGILSTIIFILIYISVFNFYRKHNKNYGLLSIFIFWTFVPLFWGHIYNGTTGFIQFFFPLTIFSIFLHPDIYRPTKILI